MIGSRLVTLANNWISSILPNQDKPPALSESLAQKAILLIGGICLLTFIATVLFIPRSDGHLTGSDGTRYYAILRSFVFDFDFDFENDYDLLGISWGYLTGKTATGLRENPFAIGAALLWLPFFLIAHIISLILNAVGLNVSTNGVGYLYEGFALVGTIIYTSIGFLLVYKVSRKLHSIQPAMMAVLGMWFATQVIYYMVLEPAYDE